MCPQQMGVVQQTKQRRFVHVVMISVLKLTDVNDQSGS